MRDTPTQGYASIRRLHRRSVNRGIVAGASARCLSCQSRDEATPRAENPQDRYDA